MLKIALAKNDYTVAADCYCFFVNGNGVFLIYNLKFGLLEAFLIIAFYLLLIPNLLNLWKLLATQVPKC